jgi:hypothetical protein
MKRDKSYFTSIIIIGFLALCHQYLQKQLSIQLPWLHAYLDDMLCMPLFLAIWRWEKQLFWKTDRLRKTEVIFFTCFIFILFEGILPRFSIAYTADWKDGLAYICGSSLFWILQPQYTITANTEH